MLGEKYLYHWLTRTRVGKPLSDFLKAFDDRLHSLIFVATTGRSGSGSLASVFRAVTGMAAFHEPEPVMNGKPMIERNFGRNARAKEVYDHAKAVSIRLRALGHRYYAETNHIFIKGFYDYVIADFPGKVKIVHLYRDPVKVASSLYRLGLWPGSPKGNKWCLDMNGTENVIQISADLAENGELNHPFFRCLWYWYETEARVSRLRHNNTDLLIVDFFTEHLQNVEALCELMENLGLVYREESIAAVAGTRRNLKISRKPSGDLSPREAKAMHKIFEQYLNARGYDWVVNSTERLQLHSKKYSVT